MWHQIWFNDLNSVWDSNKNSKEMNISFIKQNCFEVLMNTLIWIKTTKLTQAGSNCQFPARRSKTTCNASVVFSFMKLQNCFNDVLEANFNVSCHQRHWLYDSIRRSWSQRWSDHPDQISAIPIAACVFHIHQRHFFPPHCWTLFANRVEMIEYFEVVFPILNWSQTRTLWMYSIRHVSARFHFIR